MSMLQEYGKIRKWLGEETYQAINKYLDYHPDMCLSDIYYNPEVWAQFEQWRGKQ